MCGTKVVCTGCLYVDCRRTTPSPVRGGLPPLFRLIHPQPLMTQAKQNKERFIYRRSARSLVFLSLFIFFPPLSLFLIFLSFLLPLPSTGPVSFALFLSSSSHASTRPYGFLRSHSTPSPCPTHIRSLPLSVSLSYLPTLLPTFYSFSLSRPARSLTCAQMKSIKMLGATSRQSCSTPTPELSFRTSRPVLAVLRSNLRQTPTPSP